MVSAGCDKYHGPYPHHSSHTPRSGEPKDPSLGVYHHKSMIFTHSGLYYNRFGVV